MKKLVIANLKMNLNNDEILDYVKEINKKHFDNNVVICPTDIYISYFLKQKYAVGIQNIFYEEKGAYTGKTSPLQAYSMGIEYVLLGHSERRYFGENDDLINKKVNSSLVNKMKVILCIGETKEERSKAKEVLNNQLDKDLASVDSRLFNNLIIAYEPRWAIGNNITPSNEEIDEIAHYVKSYLKQKYDLDIKFIYGGSVNENNIINLKSIASINGFLVGGASLNPDKLDKIVKVVNN